MTEIKTIEQYIEHYGKPVYRFTPDLTGISPEQKGMQDIPDECCIFSIPHESKVMAVSRYGENWIPNYGQRAIIYQLLKVLGLMDAQQEPKLIPETMGWS